MPRNPADKDTLKFIQARVEELKNGAHPKIVEDIFHKVPEFLKSEDKLPKFDYKNFKYEELIKNIKKSLKPLSSALSSIQLDATGQQYAKEIYKILTDENYKYSIPHILIKQYKTKIERFTAPIPRELATKLDSYSAMIVSKYLDADAIKKLTMVCKKFGDTLKTLHFNPIPLTNKKIRELFPNMETQYIYSKDDMIFKDGNIKKHQIEGSVSNSMFYNEHPSVINFYAFQNWKPDIKTVYISPTVTHICPSSFAGSSIEHIIIRSRVKLIISNFAFHNSSLKSITLPPLLVDLDTDAFRFCEDNPLELIFENGICEDLDISGSYGFSRGTVVVKYKGNLSDELRLKFIDAFHYNVEFVKI